jgi:hypothetical protein
MELVKPTGKRPLWRPRRRWEDSIRMDLKEIDANTRIVIIGEILWMQYSTQGFYKPWSYLVRPLWWSRGRWKDNIRMDLKEIGINTRIVIIGETLWMQYLTYGFHKPWSYLKLQERDLYGGLGVDGRTILEWTLKK